MSEQKKPETIEEMTKRIREEEKAKIDADKPRDVTPTFDVGGSKPKKGGGVGGLQLYASIAIIALIICFITNAVMGVSASKFNSDISSLNNQISTLNTSVKNLQTSVSSITTGQTTDEANLQTAINNTASQFTAINAQITTLQGDFEGLPNMSQYATTAQLDTITSAVSAAQNTLTSLQSAVQNAPSSSQLTALQNSITSLQSSITADEAKITTDEANIKTLQTTVATIQTTTTTTTPVTTTTSSGSTTQNGVTAIVANNPYYGKPVLVFTNAAGSATTPAITTGNSQTQSFQLTLTNNSGVAINSQLLAIGLSIYNSTGTSLQTLPTDAQVTMASAGIGTTWTNEGYVESDVIGFENTAPSGIFASLGQISLGIGQSTTLTLNVTVTAGATTNILPFLMYVQVIPLASS